MAAHAKLGPSSSDRWMTCLPSVAFVDMLVALGFVEPGGSSVYADEGTAAHEIRELCLSLGLDPHHFLGMRIYVNGAPYECTQEMCEALQPGIDWIRSHTMDPDVEIRVDLSPWLPGQFGTMDGGWVSGDTLYASDLKYGMGESVSAEDNRQQKLYALGYWHYLGRPAAVKKVVVCIDQPRAGGLKFWPEAGQPDYLIEDLLAFGEECKEVYAKLQQIEAQAEGILTVEDFYARFKDSFSVTQKGCRWCKASGPNKNGSYAGCPARNDFFTDYFQGQFDDLDVEPDFPSPLLLDPAKRFFIVKHAADAKKWLAAMHEASLAAALDGNPDPGSKAVIGQRGDRYFTNAVKAKEILESALGSGAYKPKQLIGVPDAEKALKPGRKKPGNAEAWELLNALVDQPAGKPILVPVEDAREPIKAYEDMFDDLD